MNNKTALELLLKDRSACTKLTLELIRQYDKPVITFSLNIPGIIKTNVLYQTFFQKYYQSFLSFLTNKNNYSLVYEITQENRAGNYAWVIVNEQDAVKLKKMTYQFELLTYNISNLLDIDVYIKEQKITRQDLGLLPRKCYLCDSSAKLCARSQKHRFNELQNYIETIIINNL